MVNMMSIIDTQVYIGDRGTVRVDLHVTDGKRIVKIYPIPMAEGQKAHEMETSLSFKDLFDTPRFRGVYEIVRP
jgi:hypothetical protein